VLSGYVGMDARSARTGAVTSYKDEFNVDPVPVRLPLSSMNTLSFCHGKRSECRIPDPPTDMGCNVTPFGVFFARVWWVKITAAVDGKIVYRCVTRRGHTDMTGGSAPTARWRWVANDETVWEYCMARHRREVSPNSISAGWTAQE